MNDAAKIFELETRVRILEGTIKSICDLMKTHIKNDEEWRIQLCETLSKIVEEES